MTTKSLEYVSPNSYIHKGFVLHAENFYSQLPVGFTPHFFEWLSTSGFSKDQTKSRMDEIVLLIAEGMANHSGYTLHFERDGVEYFIDN